MFVNRTEELAYLKRLCKEKNGRLLILLSMSVLTYASAIILSLLVVGIVLLVAAIIAIYLGARRSRTATGMTR